MKLFSLSLLVALCALASCNTAEITDPIVATTDTPVPSLADVTDDKAKKEAKASADKKAAESGPTWNETYAKLLNKYVAPNGVRYASWKANSADLTKLQYVVDSIAAPRSSTNLAFYLNAYNAWILHQILEDFPTKGPGGGNALGRNAFFGGNNITVAGSKTSFNDLENEVIRKRFNEPRIHFALNCASAGCPPLMNKPFDQSYLESDLSRLTRSFVNNNPHGVRKSGANTYSLSEIFTWFEEDFGNVREFINRYRSEKIPADATLESHDYDWALNSAS